MKKIFIAVLTLTVLLAGCSKSADSGRNGGTDFDSIASEMQSRRAEADENEVKKTEKTEKTEETTKAEKSSDKVFNGNGYTFSYNPKLWRDNYSALEQALKNADASGMDISEDEIREMADCIFIYLKSRSGYDSHFNITAADTGFDDDTDLSAYASEFENIYNGVEGYNVIDTSTAEISGRKAFVITVDNSSWGMDLRLSQYIMLNGGKQYAITFSSLKETYDDEIAEFQKILDTFTFV